MKSNKTSATATPTNKVTGAQAISGVFGQVGDEDFS